MTQPEALRLAEILMSRATMTTDQRAQAAIELRRLHEKCEALTEDTIEEMRRINEIHELTAQRDALLEALKLARPHISTYTLDGYHTALKADVAIAKAEGDGT